MNILLHGELCTVQISTKDIGGEDNRGESGCREVRRVLVRVKVARQKYLY